MESRPDKNKRDLSGVLLCGLCVLSFATSGYLAFRGMLLESRVTLLESQLQEILQLREEQKPEQPAVQRLKREIPDRTSRDVSECICPPGRE